MEIKKHGEDIINFLSDLRNYAPIMPSGVSKFIATDKDNCSYIFNGVAKISMRIDRIHTQTDNNTFRFGEVILTSNDFKDMSLSAHVLGSVVQIIFSADLTPMQKVLMSGQMHKFVEEILSKLKKVME